MMLYLMQHAQAVPADVDPERPLSPEGLAAVERVALRAAQLDVPVARIYHSGKLRARQTAEVLGAALHLENNVEALEGLGPKDRAEPLARWLRVEMQKHAAGGLVLVSHLPLLERLAALLLTGDEEMSVVAIQYAALLALAPKGDGKHFVVQWLLTPELA
ncbi:MAG TPA: phosphohistidine phosphatase SixA [Ktedonobacterales bacterium]|nr:phosphohistidine phosphatase SixA [Ktedonobacterales bacterium]